MNGDTELGPVLHTGQQCKAFYYTSVFSCACMFDFNLFFPFFSLFVRGQKCFKKKKDKKKNEISLYNIYVSVYVRVRVCVWMAVNKRKSLAQEARTAPDTQLKKKKKRDVNH